MNVSAQSEYGLRALIYLTGALDQTTIADLCTSANRLKVVGLTSVSKI